MRSTPEPSGYRTACLLISCHSSDSSHYWLIVDRHPTTRPLCSVPITGTSPLLRGVPPSWRATGTPPLAALPLATRFNQRISVSRRGVLLFRCEARTELAPPSCRTPPDQYTGTRLTYPRTALRPWFRCHIA